MKANFQGQLEEEVLVNLLQYLSMNGASGLLQLRDETGGIGEIYLDSGQVVHVATGEATGITALALLLIWTGGRFTFRAGVPSPERTVTLPLDSLLLKAAYEVDVSVEQPPSLSLSEQSILSPKPVNATQAQVSLSLKSLHLLRHLDGKAALAEIAEKLSAPVDEILQAGQELVDQGLVNMGENTLVEPGFVEELTKLSLDIMGPVADIVVEETLFDLGLSAEALPEDEVPGLLTALSQQFQRADWQQTFEVRARRLCEKYGLGSG